MKFLVLRTDLKKKLRNIKLLIVDAKIFTAELDQGLDSILENIDSTKLNRLISDDIKVILCSNNSNGNHIDKLNSDYFKYCSLDGLSFSEFVNRASKDYQVKMEEIAFINVSITDHSLFSNLNFFVATNDAPLEIKTNSYYVSNFTGSKTFNEVIQLIFSARSA